MQNIDRMQSQLLTSNKVNDTYVGAWILGIIGLFASCISVKTKNEDLEEDDSFYV